MSSVVADNVTSRSYSSVRIDVASTIEVTIVDPHQLFRECLASALAEDERFKVVGVAESGEGTLARLAVRCPDVLVIALGGDAGATVELTREAVRRFPRTRVLILGSDAADEQILASLAAGAAGYVLRDQSLSDLRDAIAVVARGETACSPRIAHVLFSRLATLGSQRRRRERLDYLNLTARELEILRLIAEGLGNHEIADRLYLSVHTVKNHVHNILETLGVRSRWGAVRHALDKGWLPERARN